MAPEPSPNLLNYQTKEESKNGKFMKMETFIQKVISPELNRIKKRQENETRRSSIMMTAQGNLDKNKSRDMRDISKKISNNEKQQVKLFMKKMTMHTKQNLRAVKNERELTQEMQKKIH